MLVIRKSPFSGVINTMDIPVTKEQLDSWKNGTPIQKAMPNIPAEQREFILTGITPQEWNDTFGEE